MSRDYRFAQHCDRPRYGGRRLDSVRHECRTGVELDPNIEIAISSYQGGPIGSSPDDANATLPAAFVDTLGTEDDRLPRMDIGLGVWTGQMSRYYPLESIRAEGNVLIDEFDGRNMLIYVDPTSFTPTAFYVDAAEARFEGKEIRLDDGSVVRAGVLIAPDGQSGSGERPLHVFTRWYGFALTFPGTDIYNE